MSESNPPVRSKFDKSGGKGLKAPRLSGASASLPNTGTTVAGHNERGAKYPRDGGERLGSGNGKMPRT